MLTPQKIQDLADPLESIYISMANELLVNIGKHVTKPTWTHTAAWEIQKLSELGQLTKENAAIINRWVKSIPAEIRDTMEETRRIALDQIEKQLEKAARDGYVTPPMRDSTAQVLEEYGQQAADSLNLVNTTMLQSSVQQYQRLVALTEEEYGRLMAQKEATQETLNVAAGSVASGTETRTEALRKAIQRISKEGLTGFYDKAGRSWTPEAYVNMDIRTTVHNVAIQSVKNRMEDYNTQVFQVSAHAGARPLCYPYQGKFYSWNNTAGEMETGDGQTIRYEPLNSTTYGQPAGLFGINCGHSPIPMIPGVSIPHAQDYVQPEELNNKLYAESQEQRALERKIRAAKRAVEMGDDSKEAKDAVKDAQAKMREFINRTGRTRRYDREQLYGAKKAPTPPSDKRPPKPQAEQENVKPQLTTPKIEPVKISSVLGASLGDDLEEYRKMLEKAAPGIGKTYTDYSDQLGRVTRVSSGGEYRGNSIEWAYSDKDGTKDNPRNKYETLTHEYGHHVDKVIPKDKYTSKEITFLNENAGRLSGIRFNIRIAPVKASSSDEFLTGMRADRENLKVYLTNPAERHRIRDELFGNGNRNRSAGIQDAFDGFWSTQSSQNYSIRMTWGHGEKYYNRNYNNNVKGFGIKKGTKEALLQLGFDASNQTKVKRIIRDYETASELWANIQAAKTVGGEELRLMEKYFPEACKAFDTIIGR